MPAKRCKAVKTRFARLEIIAPLYKRGYTIRELANEVNKRLGTKSSFTTIQKDVKYLLNEWRKSRIESIEQTLQLELARIDDTVKELWEQWEKSKQDYDRVVNSRHGVPNPMGKGEGEGSIITTALGENRTNVVGLGNTAYIAEIRQQLMERRKLLGLYTVQRTEITGKDGKDLIPTNQMSREEIMAEIARIRSIRDE